MRRYLTCLCVIAIWASSSPALAQSSSQLSYQRIAIEVAEREEEKYWDMLGVDGPSNIDMCVQASLAAQAWLEAGNAEKYGKWKRTENSRCPDVRPRRR